MPVQNEQYMANFFQRLGVEKSEMLEERERINLYIEGLADHDPMKQLKAGIDWGGNQSAQLLSGFRGTGKSTELRRLEGMLREEGAVVVYVDMQDYLNLSAPVDISDFLLSVAGAFGEGLQRQDDLLAKNFVKEGYFTRALNFLKRTEVIVNEFDMGSDIGVNLKGTLKDNPSLRRKIQEKMETHLSAFVEDVHQFIRECVTGVRNIRGSQELKVVLLLDSVEQIQGTSTNADDVAVALENLFLTHADKLRLPNLHIVYTVPPWLKIKAPGTDARYDGFQQIPCVKVRYRDNSPNKTAVKALTELVAARGDWRRLLGEDVLLEQLIFVSGGYLRDLLRLLRATLRHARGGPLPVPIENIDGRKFSPVVEKAIAEVRSGYLPMPMDNARWLAEIQVTKRISLENVENLPQLARLFDRLLVMVYRNGEEWFDIHPLIRDEVVRMNQKSGT